MWVCVERDRDGERDEGIDEEMERPKMKRAAVIPPCVLGLQGLPLQSTEVWRDWSDDPLESPPLSSLSMCSGFFLLAS